MKRNISSQQRCTPLAGFTIIELLIVIVIIGVLAGIMLSVINPQAQINKARDGTVRASLNKIALTVKGNVSAYNRVPDGLGFVTGLSNINIVAGCTAGLTTCTYTVSGSPLPATCAGVNPNSGNGAVQCNYFYYTPLITGTEFKLVARSWGSSYAFVYHSRSDATGASAGTCASGAAASNVMINGVVSQLCSFEATYICPATYTAAIDPTTVCTASQ